LLAEEARGRRAGVQVVAHEDEEVARFGAAEGLKVDLDALGHGSLSVLRGSGGAAQGRCCVAASLPDRLALP
jgi:hypothetical protein